MKPSSGAGFNLWGPVPRTVDLAQYKAHRLKPAPLFLHRKLRHIIPIYGDTNYYKFDLIAIPG
jgi:hypothetical protein